MGDSGTGPTPADAAYGQASGGQQGRQEWVRANFTQIFGISAEDLRAQGINPRQYAREHRDNIRQFAQLKMVSMWATSRPAGSRGTHAHSLIDQVFNTQRAYATKVYFGIKYSDHFPAMGTYYLTKGTGDAGPIPGPNTTRQPASLPPTTGKGLKDPHWTEGRCGDVG